MGLAFEKDTGIISGAPTTKDGATANGGDAPSKLIVAEKKRGIEVARERKNTKAPPARECFLRWALIVIDTSKM